MIDWERLGMHRNKENMIGEQTHDMMCLGQSACDILESLDRLARPGGAGRAWMGLDGPTVFLLTHLP